MKRIHLFEFEDFAWFPSLLRNYLTRYLMAVHRLLDSPTMIAGLLTKLFGQTNSRHLLDLCSGSGGPMLEVFKALIEKFPETHLTLSDLYPNRAAATSINDQPHASIRYHTQPVDASKVPPHMLGIRTMICSFHHLRPNDARQVLADAAGNSQPILIYEISDNSFPKWLWWLAFPVNILTVLIITLTVRPLSLGQIIFTYLIPILPIIIAWDGAVSNARTYTLDDLQLLLEDIEISGYTWEKDTIAGKGGRKIYLLGYPHPITPAV
jgi:hypothetical protein